MTTGPSDEISEALYKKLVRACHQFTLKELKSLLDAGSECFPSTVKSDQLQKIIIKNHLEPNKSAFMNVLEEELLKCKITQDAYTKYIQNLSFQDVILHKKKVWQTYELMDPIDSSNLNLSESQIKSNILRKMKSKLQVSALIQIQNVTNINWCMVIDIKYNKKNVPRYGNPFYFTFTEEQSSFCLCSTKSSTMIDVLVESFGYSNSKNCDLSGKDVRTLHALISKRRRPTNGSTPNTPTNMSLNRSTRNNARYLATKNFGIQEVQIKCHTEWKGSRVNKKRKKLNSVNSLLKIQAPNIGLLIRSLIENGVITEPNATWVTKLATTRSNIIECGEEDEMELIEE
uniref:Uncharacterized protein n=1 Tax=Cacopsylla melanoneura TaxID=428564 RepID=A0A8D9AG83_9HEMI